MSDPTCVRCGRPTPDGYVDVNCGITKPTEQLRAIAELTPAARLVAAGLVRRGNGGGGSNKPGSRPPINDSATDTLDEIQNAITTIARDIAETRGAQKASAGLGVADPLAEAATWLCGQLEWLRHATDDQGGPYADTVLDEIRECAGRMRWLVDGPAAQKYLGPCGAITDRCPYCASDDRDRREVIDEGDGPAWCDHGWHDGDLAACVGDVYVRDGAQRGRCRTCGAEVPRKDRQAWLKGEVRAHAFRAAHIAEAYGINVKTIRSWAVRGLLLEHGRDRDDHPLYPVGDVLDLAAADAARREGERSKRERRAAQRAEDERLSA